MMPLVAALMLLALAVPAQAGERTLDVAAAVSLDPVLGAIAHDYEATHPGVHVRLDFGPSNQLRRQIAAGAPADVFAAAADAEMDAIADLVVPDSRRTLATNALVIAVPRGHALALSKDGRRGWGACRHVAVAASEVPLGHYTQQVLQRMGIAGTLAPRLVYGMSAGQVATYLRRGEVAAAFLYATDARRFASEVSVVRAIAPTLHDSIRYPVAVLQGPQEALARDFVAFATGPKARKRLEAAGFSLVEERR